MAAPARTTRQLTGAASGSVIGIGLALLALLVIGHTGHGDSSTVPFFQVTFLIIGSYLGLTLGAARGFSWSPIPSEPVTVVKPIKPTFHILDTSVIIDGRIADIAETGFIDGGLAIPQFVFENSNWWQILRIP